MPSLWQVAAAPPSGTACAPFQLEVLKPGTATPEHLFATGYAACFGGAIDFVAKQHKKDASKAIVTCAVSIGPREGGGFGLSVKMQIRSDECSETSADICDCGHISACHE